jgi:hypothetical protein
MGLGPSVKVVSGVMAYVLAAPRRSAVTDELVVAMIAPLTKFAGALAVVTTFVPIRSGMVSGDEVGTATSSIVL